MFTHTHSVRTVDEAYSALTVSCFPLHPGRRAAVTVWTASTLVAVAVNILNLAAAAGPELKAEESAAESCDGAAALTTMARSLITRVASSDNNRTPLALAFLLAASACYLVCVKARRHLEPLGWWEDPRIQGSRRLPVHR